MVIAAELVLVSYRLKGVWTGAAKLYADCAVVVLSLVLTFLGGAWQAEKDGTALLWIPLRLVFGVVVAIGLAILWYVVTARVVH